MSRQSFLSASDYVFYLRLHNEKYKSEMFVEDISEHRSEANVNANHHNFERDSQLPPICELLKNLNYDLQYALDSFVREFVRDDGIYSVLNLLRISITRQHYHTSQSVAHLLMKSKQKHYQQNKAIHDEYDCLLCLNYCARRNDKSLEKISGHRTGLSTLASCIVSNLIKSRIIALRLLTQVCNLSNGVNKVLEAMSTLRIINGESVRFKFLIAMLNSPNNSLNNDLTHKALLFLNTLLRKTTNMAEKIRLQCEIKEAGLDIDMLEKFIQEEGISDNHPIWSEINIFRLEYINVEDVLHTNKKIKESFILKEELQYLQKSLTKLEEDKINLMQIEKELKEKCNDLEKEVCDLKSKFVYFNPTNKTPHWKLKLRETDIGFDDSGQWSDSDGDSNTDSVKSKREKLSLYLHEKNKIILSDDEQNMRNEDELIYIPAIKPPASFAHYAIRETHTQHYSNHNSCPESDHSVNYKSKQTEKPKIINVYPKQNGDNKLECGDNTIGENADRENCELILDWQYPFFEHKPSNKLSEDNKHLNSFRMMSSSMNQLNNYENDFDVKQKSQLQDKSINDFSFSRQSQQKSNLTNNKNPRKSDNPLDFILDKSKNTTQSYFYSGLSSQLKQKTENKSLETCDEISSKSFPIPISYKKKFILKGHSNCGLYSGNFKEESAEHNLSDDIKTCPKYDLSVLVHKEIAKAARDFGAWL